MDASPEPPLLRSDVDGVVRLTLNRPQAYNSLSLRAAGPARRRARPDRRGPQAPGWSCWPAPARRSAPGTTSRRWVPTCATSRCARCSSAARRSCCGSTRLPQPVIARVHGIATAAGCQLVAACDLAVCSDDARFATSGVKYGLFCSTPMVALSRNLPRKPAMEMLLTGDFIDAAEALRLGLVNQIAAPDDAGRSGRRPYAPGSSTSRLLSSPWASGPSTAARARARGGLRLTTDVIVGNALEPEFAAGPGGLRRQAQAGVAAGVSLGYSGGRAGVAQR